MLKCALLEKLHQGRTMRILHARWQDVNLKQRLQLTAHILISLASCLQSNMPITMLLSLQTATTLLN